MTELYVVDRTDSESNTETSEPMPLRKAVSVARNRMGPRMWPGAMVRPHLGEVQAWQAESGAYLCIRRATLFELEEEE